MPIAMTLLVLAALAGFAFTARKRLTLLLVGAPEDRFDRLFDRMAAPPDGRHADLAGTILVAGIFALPATALLLSLAQLSDSERGPARSALNSADNCTSAGSCVV